MLKTGLVDAGDMQAEVVESAEKTVKLGTAAGVIETPFLQEQLYKVQGRKRKLSVPNVEVPLVKALRAETSYGRKSSITSV